ncbi:MAG TPA: hypothetical protein VK688_04800 [Gemmatimonadales bacterium]|jgi:hypothetical protein|nr:hypothetical protein [Gemmatimonadales bacterium]
MRSIHTLLHGLIDYAGLFPPAQLDMAGAVAGYSSYRAGPHCWALGRFVVPVSRLAEFESAATPWLRAAGTPWKLAALAGPDLPADLATITALNSRVAGGALVDSIELKAATADAIARALTTVDARVDVYVEIPIGDDPAPLFDALARHGGRGKVRTGGVTPDAFPSPGQLLRFLRRSREAGVPFKATAGLHHPLRGAYRLTYAPNSACATMFGFLNLFLAAAFLDHGMDDVDGLALLEETSPQAFSFEEEGVTWRSHRLADAEMRHARRRSGLAFGSCSFTEPIDDLQALGLL